MCMMGTPPQRMSWAHWDDNMLFLECIIMEMRHVHYHTPETVCSSMEGEHCGSLRSKKFKVVKSAGNEVTIMF